MQDVTDQGLPEDKICSWLSAHKPSSMLIVEEYTGQEAYIKKAEELELQFTLDGHTNQT